jgi:hypothetical protein
MALLLLLLLFLPPATPRRVPCGEASRLRHAVAWTEEPLRRQLVKHRPAHRPEKEHHHLAHPSDDHAAQRGSLPMRSLNRAPVPQANSLRDQPSSEEEEEETVLVCGDCNLPIHDRDTPKFCQITGMRHY